MAEKAGLEIIPLQCNITDSKAVENEILDAQPDFVLHCAGISFVAHSDEKEFYNVHALGTTNLLNALTKLPHSPSKVLLASSATVYGNCDVSPVPESQELKPVDHYGMSKVAMEELAAHFYDRLPVTIVRPFNYTGPGQKGRFLIPKLIKHFSNKEPIIELGNLDVEREFNDVQMICEAYLNLLKFGEPGEIYNVCSGKYHSLQDVINILKEITGHSIEVKVNPAFVRKNEVHRMCGDPKKLIDILHKNGATLNPVPLRDTLANMLSEFSE